MDSCIFCKIAKGEMGTQFAYEDEKVVAFKDIHPQAPVHMLVIPRAHVSEFYKLKDDTVLPSVRRAIQALIERNGLSARGYKIEVNGGGAQLVDHLHFHLLGPAHKPVV